MFLPLPFVRSEPNEDPPSYSLFPTPYSLPLRSLIPVSLYQGLASAIPPRPPTLREIKSAAKPRSIPAQPQPSRREETKIAQAGVRTDGSLSVGWRVKPWENNRAFCIRAWLQPCRKPAHFLKGEIRSEAARSIYGSYSVACGKSRVEGLAVWRRVVFPDAG